MAKCANCEQDALYTYVISESFGIDYCSRHLPAFVEKNQSFVLIANVDTVQAEAIAEVAATTKSSKKKAADPVVEEPVVEEPVVEEPVVEEPVVEEPVVDAPAAEEPVADDATN
jgi:hypothetical protein